MHHIEGIFLFYPRLDLVDVRDHSVLDYRAVLVPGAAVFLPARGVVASLAVDQEDEEVDGVEVWHDAAKAWWEKSSEMVIKKIIIMQEGSTLALRIAESLKITKDPLYILSHLAKL